MWINKQIQKKIVLLFWAYTIFVILLCILPINDSKSSLNNTYILNIRFDYLAHTFLFTPWMFLWTIYSKASFRKNIGKILGVIAIGLIFALSSELIQYYLHYRSFNINDLIANITGIGIGILFYLYYHKPYISKI